MQLTLAMHSFNEKLRQMNQTNAKQLVLTAEDARNLQADIFSLLSVVAGETNKGNKSEDVVQINMDGGTFR